MTIVISYLINCIQDTVDLAISRGFNFREEDKFANSYISMIFYIIIAVLRKGISRILNFVKSSKIRNSLVCRPTGFSSLEGGGRSANAGSFGGRQPGVVVWPQSAGIIRVSRRRMVKDATYGPIIHQPDVTELTDHITSFYHQILMSALQKISPDF